MDLSCMVLFSDCENPNRKLVEWNTNQLFLKENGRKISMYCFGVISKMC